jgi:hypothetical protein
MEYLECCPHIGEQWAKEWDNQKNREEAMSPQNANPLGPSVV